MDSFFSKGFKGSRCKTLLKLTIPRIKLLRNRREIQLKQMRRDIAKLLETGQEATARIRVEHIIREEKMMAAQEIIELFCELIAVRLPIIETQKECPIDLKEAISSVCFAAPRCADLPELIQVQMMFTGKYGKEFVARATELMPDCGVNRQLIELLSVRAPAPDVKLKLLKDIAEEHELDWDPSASENELLKTHEDLLNGPTHFVSGYKVPLLEEKHEEVPQASSEQTNGEKSDSDVDLDSWELPEVPKQTLKTSSADVSAPEMLPFPASALSEPDDESEESAAVDDSLSKELESRQNSVEVKQYIPFMSPPPKSPTAGYVDPKSPTTGYVDPKSPTTGYMDPKSPITGYVDPKSPTTGYMDPKSPITGYVDPKSSSPLPSVPAAKSQADTDWQEALAAARAAAETPKYSADSYVDQTPKDSADGYVDQRTAYHSPSVAAATSYTDADLQNLLAEARAAAETAERAAVSARSAASLAEMRINEHSRRNSYGTESNVSTENPFHANTDRSNPLDRRSSFDKFHDDLKAQSSLHNGENHFGPEMLKVPSYDDSGSEYVSFSPKNSVPVTHRVQRLPSMDDEYSYPNLFGSQGSHTPSRSNSFADNSRSTPE